MHMIINELFRCQATLDIPNLTRKLAAHSYEDVSTVCFGMAASMGSFLLAAGTKGKRLLAVDVWGKVWGVPCCLKKVPYV